MTLEERTQNIFISTNGYKDLYDFKRGILPEDDEYKRRPREIENKDEDEQ